MKEFARFIAAFPANGNRRPETPTLCLSKKRAKASGEAFRSNPLVLYHQGAQEMEGISGLCPAKNRYRVAKAQVS